MLTNSEGGGDEKEDEGLQRKESFKNFQGGSQTNAGTLAGISLLNANDTTVVNDIDLPIHIGISSGLALEAVIGDDASSVQRLATGLIGEAHNRARENLALAQADFGKIYLDYDTAMQARVYLNVEYVKHADTKGSPLRLPIFEPKPIDELDRLSLAGTGINVKQLF